MELSQALINKNYTEFEKLIESQDKSSPSFISLYIRYLIYTNNDNIHKYIMENKLMKRDFLIYLNYFPNNENTNLLLNRILKEVEINDTILLLLQRYPIFYKSIENRHFYKTNVTYLYKSKVLEFLEKHIYINHKFIERLKNVNIIIDTANMIHTNKGFDYTKIDNLNKKYKNPLFIASSKHKKHLKNYNRYITDTKYYDDYYILYGAVYNNCKIITKDNYKDIIFKVTNYINDINCNFKGYLNNLIY